ncbi:DnaJ domain protein [Cyanobium sp. PCC 7001]|uniref:J domain-containing protein n=1 Tax=Cyanobium sp. PCC 7001 TaxID=180281 RepID=UPI00018052D0|nr:J domain-containing protein [Cyanobium sp. PCC 7001]EDY37289.1 DnaJ domain protein [Cyanobium sp. PCC 7001]
MPRHRPLHTLFKGGVSCAVGGLVAVMIDQGVRVHLRHGNHQIAADSLHMLWAPAVFLLVGALLLGQGLIDVLALLVAALPWPRRSAHPGPPVRRAQRYAPAAAARPPLRAVPAAPDPYLQACRHLGVEPGSSWPQIRAAWRRNVTRWHPDAGGDPELWHQRLAAYRLLEASQGLRLDLAA